MKNVQNFVLPLLYFLLICLWVYAALSKLLVFSVFKLQMQSQVLWPFLKTLLIYGLPPYELIIAMLISTRSARPLGLLMSVVTLSAFTIYIGLAVFHAFPKRPCSCGGILNHIGWGTHLTFNFFVIGLNSISIYFTKKERRLLSGT